MIAPISTNTVVCRETKIWTIIIWIYSVKIAGFNLCQSNKSLVIIVYTAAAVNGPSWTFEGLSLTESLSDRVSWAEMPPWISLDPHSSRFPGLVAAVSFCCSFRLMPKWISKETGNVIYPTKRKYPPKDQLLVCRSFWMTKSFPHYDMLVLSDNQQIKFEVITGAGTLKKKWNALFHKIFCFICLH